MEISKVSQALENFYTTYDRYPTNQEGLPILAKKNDDFADGILTFIPQDPWGNNYEYVSPGKSRPFDIICYGADNREGGDGANKDIVSADLGRR